MTAEFKHFLKLRDDLFVAMTEAAAKRVASESLKDQHYIVAALLAAHVACCDTIIQCAPDEFKERWIEEFIEGAKKTLLRNNIGGNETPNTLH